MVERDVIKVTKRRRRGIRTKMMTRWPGERSGREEKSRRRKRQRRRKNPQ